MFHLQDKEPGAERGSDSLAGARGPGGAAARLPCPAPSAPAGLAAAGNSVLSLVGPERGGSSEMRALRLQLDCDEGLCAGWFEV